MGRSLAHQINGEAKRFSIRKRFKHLSSNIKNLETSTLFPSLRSRRIPDINPFFKRSFMGISRAHRKKMKQFSEFARFGGGSKDAFNYLHMYDNDLSKTKQTFNVKTSDLANELLDCKRRPLVCLKRTDVTNGKLTLDTNPGPTYTRLGFKSKREALKTSRIIANEVVRDAKK